MPLFTYHCEDCGETLELLHPIEAPPQKCGLSCRRRDAGAFGAGRVKKGVDAPNIKTSGLVSNNRGSSEKGREDRSREALRARALTRLGDKLTEGDLDRLRDGGMTVYRREGNQAWAKDGGDEAAPSQIRGTPNPGKPHTKEKGG